MRALAISLSQVAMMSAIVACLLVRWLLTFGGACVYAVCAFPWDEKVLAWPGKK